MGDKKRAVRVHVILCLSLTGDLNFVQSLFVLRSDVVTLPHSNQPHVSETLPIFACFDNFHADFLQTEVEQQFGFRALNADSLMRHQQLKANTDRWIMC